MGFWRDGWGFTWGFCRGEWGFTWGPSRAVGVSHGVLPGVAEQWGFTWGPGGAVGVSHGVLAARLGFHMRSCRAWRSSGAWGPGSAVGVSHGDMGSWRAGWGFTWSPCSWRAGWGFTWSPCSWRGGWGFTSGPGVVAGASHGVLGCGWGFTWGFCRAVATPKSSTRKLKLQTPSPTASWRDEPAVKLKQVDLDHSFMWTTMPLRVRVALGLLAVRNVLKLFARQASRSWVTAALAPAPSRCGRPVYQLTALGLSALPEDVDFEAFVRRSEHLGAWCADKLPSLTALARRALTLCPTTTVVEVRWFLCSSGTTRLLFTNHFLRAYLARCHRPSPQLAGFLTASCMCKCKSAILSGFSLNHAQLWDIDAAPWGPKLWAPSATRLGFSLIGAPTDVGSARHAPTLPVEQRASTGQKAISSVTRKR